MKKVLISTLAAALVASFAVSADAATTKQKVSAEVQASCKAQAAREVLGHSLHQAAQLR